MTEKVHLDLSVLKILLFSKTGNFLLSIVDLQCCDSFSDIALINPGGLFQSSDLNNKIDRTLFHNRYQNTGSYTIGT